MTARAPPRGVEFTFPEGPGGLKSAALRAGYGIYPSRGTARGCPILRRVPHPSAGAPSFAQRRLGYLQPSKAYILVKQSSLPCRHANTSPPPRRIRTRSLPHDLLLPSPTVLRHDQGARPRRSVHVRQPDPARLPLDRLYHHARACALAHLSAGSRRMLDRGLVPPTQPRRPRLLDQLRPAGCHGQIEALPVSATCSTWANPPLAGLPMPPGRRTEQTWRTAFEPGFPGGWFSEAGFSAPHCGASHFQARRNGYG